VMAASAPSIVMPASAPAHVAMPMSMASMNENDRIIGVANQRACRGSGHRRGG
jgi:hypothetical protein